METTIHTPIQKEHALQGMPAGRPAIAPEVSAPLGTAGGCDRSAASTAGICTLFEGHYHYGLGALANSLYAHGFRGTIWAGYRGNLPPWAQPCARDERSGHFIFQMGGGCCIRFVPLEIDIHLTNYKPDFMLEIFDLDPGASALFYFDPDIVVRCPWSYFEEWASTGVALCEDVNSPLPVSHPLRAQWRRIYGRAGMALDFPSEVYVNGGFQGIARRHREFLLEWQRVQEVMVKEIGSLKKTGADIGGREMPFAKTDQDALNVTLGLTKQPLSLMGKEGMDIAPGGFTMSHTLGPQKAWKTNFVASALKGRPPSLAMKNYFHHVEAPIRLFPPQVLRLRKLELAIAAAMGRFYRCD